MPGRTEGDAKERDLTIGWARAGWAGIRILVAKVAGAADLARLLVPRLNVAKGVNPGMKTWCNLIDGSKVVIEEPNWPHVGAVTAKLVCIEAELVSGPIARDSYKPIRHPDLTPAKRFLNDLPRRIEVMKIMQIQSTLDDRV